MIFEHDILDNLLSGKHMSRTWCSENMELSLHISAVVHKDCKLALVFCTSPTK